MVESTSFSEKTSKQVAIMKIFPLWAPKYMSDKINVIKMDHNKNRQNILGIVKSSKIYALDLSYVFYVLML